MKFYPIESVKVNLGSLKYDPCVKHLFLWLFIELQHKLCKRYLNITDKNVKKCTIGVYYGVCVRPAIFENRLCLNCILINYKVDLYTLVTLQLS